MLHQNGSWCPWGICWQTLWAVHLEWCRLWAPWVMRHTGGWPVWSNHRSQGSEEGFLLQLGLDFLEAGGVMFSSMWSILGGHLSVSVELRWERMSGGSWPLLGMIVALASSGWCRSFGSFSWIRGVAFCREHSSKECYGLLFNGTLFAWHESFLLGHIEQIDNVASWSLSSFP